VLELISRADPCLWVGITGPIRPTLKLRTWKSGRQEILANAHETHDSININLYAGCLGLSPVYFSENSL